MANPVCELFLTDDDTTFLLQSFSPKERDLATASLTAFQHEKMRESASQILFGDLRAFASRVASDDYRVCNFYPNQQCRYRMLTIGLRENMGLDIEVWHIDFLDIWRGSHGEIYSVPATAGNEEVYNALMLAFGRCREFLWLGVPMAPLPYVEVYQSELFDRFSIIRWVDVPLKDPRRGITLWGYPLTMSRQQFMDRGHGIIALDQREYPRRTLEENPNRRPSPVILKSDGYLDQKKISVQFDASKDSYNIQTHVFSERLQDFAPESPVIQIRSSCTDAVFYDAIFKALAKSRRVPD